MASAAADPVSQSELVEPYRNGSRKLRGLFIVAEKPRIPSSRWE
jgi:hypothetical protein